MWEPLRPFLLSAVIGLLIGIEREKSHPFGTQAFGVRTFVLVALLGAVAAVVPLRPVAIVISIFVMGGIWLGYARSTRRAHSKDIGLTTEFTAFFVFCAGLLSFDLPEVVAVLSVLVLAVLLSRTWIHRFSRQTLRPVELQALVTLLVLAVGIVPLLPKNAIDPWGAFYPQRFGIIVVAIAGLQFVSYILLRMLGSKVGLPVAGFLGGLVSSSAVFLTLPRHVGGHTTLNRPVLSALTSATGASILQLAVLVAATAPVVRSQILAPTLGMVLVALIIGIMTAVTSKPTRDGVAAQQLPSPLNLKSVLNLALLIGGLLALTRLAQHSLGDGGAGVLSFLAGAFELHANAFAIANLITAGEVSPRTGVTLLWISVIASFVSKTALIWMQPHKRLAAFTTLILVLMLCGGALGLTFVAN